MANTKKYVSLDKLGLYDEKIKKYLADADAVALQSAKDYCDSKDSQFDAAGSAATVQGKLDEEVARAKAAEEANAAAAKKAQDEVDALELVVQNIQENAYNDAELRGLISGLDTNKADKTQVAIDIAAAVKVETDARVEAVAAVQGAVDALSGTHATDKKALEDAIALKADKTAVDGVIERVTQAEKDIDAIEAMIGEKNEDLSEVFDDVWDGIEKLAVGVESLSTNLAAETSRATEAEAGLASRIKAVEDDYLKAADKEELQGAIDAEAERAAGEEVKLANRIKAVEDDYLKAADKTELQGNIDTVSAAVELLTNGVKADEVDGVNDLIAYVKEHGTEVTGMQEGIAKNAEDIGKVAGRVEVLEGEMNAVEGAVATKAEKTYVDEQVQALQGVDAGIDARLKIVEGKFTGEGSVEGMIADAKQEAIDAAVAKDAEVLAAAKKYADDEDAKIESRVDALEGASATHALKSEVEAVAGRVTTVEGKVSTLEGEMDAVEELAAAADAAAKANADAIAKLGDTYATDEELAQAIEGAKADAANKDAVVLAEAQNGIAAVQTAVDTHAAKADIHVTAEDKAKWNVAEGKAHEHSNLSVLEGITAAKVSAWDAKANAATTLAGYGITDAYTKTETDTAISNAVAKFVEVSEEEINALFA